MDYSALIKSNTLENTVNNGWIIIVVKYGFIRLLQRIFNCDNMQDISITSNKVLNSLTYGSPFCVIIIIHELQTVKNGKIFHGLN